LVGLGPRRDSSKINCGETRNWKKLVDILDHGEPA
jgi:hypothetical protein